MYQGIIHRWVLFVFVHVVGISEGMFIIIYIANVVVVAVQFQCSNRGAHFSGLECAHKNCSIYSYCLYIPFLPPFARLIGTSFSLSLRIVLLLSLQEISLLHACVCMYVCV